MVALVEHVELGPVAIHRTWLQTDGAAKASFRNPRLSLGPIGGGAVRLAAAREDVPLNHRRGDRDHRQRRCSRWAGPAGRR